MKPRLIILLLLIVALPLGLLAAVGVMLSREERAIQEHRTRELLRAALVEVDGSIGRLLEERRRELLRLTNPPSLTPETLREWVRDQPLVRQMFVLSADGRMLFPSEGDSLTRGEREFLERSAPIWPRGELWARIQGRIEPAVNLLNQATNAVNVQTAMQMPVQVQTIVSGNPTTPTQQQILAPQWAVPQSPDEQRRQQAEQAPSQQSREQQPGQTGQQIQGQAQQQRSQQQGEYPQQAGQQSVVPAPNATSQNQQAQSVQPPPVSQQQSGLPQAANQFPNFVQQGTPTPPGSGWHAWYWGNGTHLLFWRRQPGGVTVGAELDRARLQSDVINLLPTTDPAATRAIPGRIVLRDANGEALYQWGRHEPGKGEQPAASLGLSPPLQAWRLDDYVPAELLAGNGRSLWFSMLAGLVGSGALLILLAGYFYRESSREMREAAQRVNFVNQVSHELKTPLTNIRMYAELMEGRIDGQEGGDGDPRARHYLEVISSESQRLSRLIGNVLTFGRSQRGALKLHPTTCRLDEIVTVSVERFRPALDQRRLRLELALDGGEPVRLDPDAVEQILCNLLSNVEKYGGQDAAVRVTSRREGEAVVITVSDEGPGIPASEREKIFRPFYRISNRLADGVSGTGIGLSIARELARRHGGELRLNASKRGACFELRLRPLEEKEGANA